MRKCALAIVLAAINGGSILAAEKIEFIDPVKFEYDAYYRQGGPNTSAGPEAPKSAPDSGEVACCAAVGCCDPCGCGSGCAPGGLLSCCSLAAPIEGFSLANAIGARGT